MHISPTQEAVAQLMARGITCPVTMLNLVRFRSEADCSDYPDLAPSAPISGEMAYDIYIGLTLPHVQAVAGKAVFVGSGGELLIGPSEARWDRVLLIEYPNIEAFFQMVQSPEYQAGAGHRTAALEDSRLLPIE